MMSIDEIQNLMDFTNVNESMIPGNYLVVFMIYLRIRDRQKVLKMIQFIYHPADKKSIEGTRLVFDERCV